jgi:hypothetical protein
MISQCLFVVAADDKQYDHDQTISLLVFGLVVQGDKSRDCCL